ncbi:ATP-dependent DNA helicase [Anaerosporobacter faecicola]|uniref:ATP-dependent DNA helicase n=1 Tax=Anaerosporobacter faecicola TaxID=2718714 RepID=UPI0014399722|nr:ATP-dependent DNA helicase [Anaerosporobacter faecicola]
MSLKRKEPFEYGTIQEFPDKLVEWIGDILYDFLPEHGYEVREEQVYTAFQIADAFGKKKVHLAEAGLGTGKTIAYLLSAIAYARLQKKPVVIACASTALQQQLVSEHGDIAALSRLLDLDIDVRLAKDPKQYLCDVRASDVTLESNENSKQITEWLRETKRGERSEIPTVSDAVWRKMNWNDSLVCELCESRGYCKLMKAREHYRGAMDLLIVDHETFFRDLWSREERIANGQLPILPNYCGVILDEGHRILLPAAMQAGQQLSKEDLESMIENVMEIQGARESFHATMLAMEQTGEVFFEILQQSVITSGSSERQEIQQSNNLQKVSQAFQKVLENMLFELQIEQELYTENIELGVIQGYEIQLERAIHALEGFCGKKKQDCIAWVDRRDQSLWVVPKNSRERLQTYLYRKNIPVIFTSATLSNNGDFSYLEQKLGLEKASRSSIGSPFDLESQVQVILAESQEKQGKKGEEAVKKLVSAIKENEGRALILTNTFSEMLRLRKLLAAFSFPFEILWEDQGERGYLIDRFRKEESSVLIGTSFWEGIDIPGESLTMVVIWQLPFPKSDPFIELEKQEAKAKGKKEAEVVDYPEMGLKIKQGCGRLIRTSTDHGKILIFDSVKGMPWEGYVLGALPGK